MEIQRYVEDMAEKIINCHREDHAIQLAYEIINDTKAGAKKEFRGEVFRGAAAGWDVWPSHKLTVILGVIEKSVPVSIKEIARGKDENSLEV